MFSGLVGYFYLLVRWNFWTKSFLFFCVLKSCATWKYPNTTDFGLNWFGIQPTAVTSYNISLRSRTETPCHQFTLLSITSGFIKFNFASFISRRISKLCESEAKQSYVYVYMCILGKIYDLIWRKQEFFFLSCGNLKQILELPIEFCFFFTERFSFLGTRILEKVIEELMSKGLYHAKRLLLAGSRSLHIILTNFDYCY